METDHDSVQMERRRFIQRVCAASAVTSTGLAGCTSFGGDGGGDGGDGGGGSDGGDGGGDGNSGGDGDGGGDGGVTSADTPTESPTATAAASLPEGERAAYDRWASAATYPEEQIQALTVDMALIRSQTGGSTPTETPSPAGTPQPIDPAVGLPLTYFLVASFSSFALVGFNVTSVAGEGGGVEQIHSPGNGLVFQGSFDPARLGEQIGESQASEAGSYEGYTVYERGSGEDRSVLAVSGEALVHASSGEDVSDPRAVAESVVDAGAGNAAPYGDDHPAYADLVTALGSAPIMGVAYSPDGAMNRNTPTPTPTPAPGTGGGDFFNMGELDLDGAVLGVATALGFGPDQQRATAQMAVRYASPGDVDETSLIRSQAAPRANDVSVVTSGALVVVTAEYGDLSRL